MSLSLEAGAPWAGPEAEQELAKLHRKIDAARRILLPLADCDPDIRQWLGLPRFGSGDLPQLVDEEGV